MRFILVSAVGMVYLDAVHPMKQIDPKNIIQKRVILQPFLKEYGHQPLVLIGWCPHQPIRTIPNH
jgi:hypothetical protein